MKITNVECHVLVVDDLTVNANSSAQEDIVEIVHTDEGISGVGEADTRRRQPSELDNQRPP